MKDVRASIPTSNYSKGRSHSVDQITFHHIVGDAPAALARFRKPGEQVSSTYVIGSDGTVYYVVDEKNTPYTNGDTPSTNPRSITIEHAGPPYSAKMYQASINLVREIRKRHKITRFKRHRDLVATACPGKLDVEKIIKASGSATGEQDMKMTRGDVIWAHRLARRPTTEAKIKALVGTDFDKWAKSVTESSWFKDDTAKIKGTPDGKFKQLAQKVKDLIPFTK